MIIDVLVAPLLRIVERMFRVLPEGQALDLPGMQSMTDIMAKVNSVIPVGPVVQMAVVLLGALVVFLLIRLVLVIVNIVWW